ncbi:cell division protein FtsX [Camelimonas abortus]|uniref:Cell division protein FtsX n=1 Tax=Camelimonas abortus TaxID=1017184 RepID=A0ABV7LGY5_9HYPH
MSEKRFMSLRRPSPTAARPAADAAGGAGQELSRGQALVPADSGASRALVSVIAILTFLAALTACAAVLVARASAEWRSDVVREMTIQVRPVAQRNIEADVDRAAAIARAAPGVAGVRVISRREAERMLEPWLGGALSFAELPVPRLIVLRLAPGGGPDVASLRKELEQQVPTATLDDHHAWMSRLAAMAGAMVAAGAVIVLLVLTAAALAVAFATRGAMDGNREIVEVLHFVGASDRYIARQFQSHFLWLGLKGGLIGGAAALALAAAFGALSGMWRSGPGGDQLEALFGAFEIGWQGYAAVLAIAGVVALVTAVMSRVTVSRHLRELE